MVTAADPVLARITNYLTAPPRFSALAYRTARMSLLDSLGCALLALDVPECRRLLGPLAAPAPGAESAPAGARAPGGPRVSDAATGARAESAPGAPHARDAAPVQDAARAPATTPAPPEVPLPDAAPSPDATRAAGAAPAPGTVRVPGTALALDPVTAAFNTGTLIRWLDYNDTWLAAEWGHPSDNLGALLAAAQMRGLSVRDLLTAQIQAYEIQGILALQNSFNRLGLDHVILVRIASAGVAARLLGGTPEQVLAALSHAFLDGGALRTYRHGATTGSRKSWAAGDATSRGLWLALLALRGEMGYPAALSAPRWGFQDVVLRGAEVRLEQPLGCYVAENILFKVGFPAEFHGQTAVEAAFALHPEVAPRAAEVAEIVIHTQEPAMRIIDKQGPLTTPAARDHCLQYMVAVALLLGELRGEHYRDAAAADPRIDFLRERTRVHEDPRYTEAYLDPGRRAIGNRVQVHFRDGTSTSPVAVEYPLGHPRRRAEAEPHLAAKFARTAARLPAPRAAAVRRLWDAPERTDRLTVDQFLARFAP